MTTPNAKPRAGEHTALPWQWYWREESIDGVKRADCGIFHEKRPGHAYSVCRAPQYAKKEEWEANARRIVACVNYLEGTSTEELEARIASRRNGEPYGRKSLRFIREFVKRGAHLNRDHQLVLPSGGIHQPDIQWGRDRVNIGVDGEACTVQIARVICFMAHGEPTEESMVADHIDGNTLNDAPGNLRWATYSENNRNRAAAREGQ